MNASKMEFFKLSPNNGGLTVRIQVNIRKYDTQVCNLTWGIMEIIAVPGITKAGTGFEAALGDSAVTNL